MQVFYSPRNLEEVYMFLFKLKYRQKKQVQDIIVIPM